MQTPRPFLALALVVALLGAHASAFAKPKPKPKPAATAAPTAQAPDPPPPPPVDPNEARVAELRKRGDAAMDGGNPSDALAAYSEASTLSPDPALLYNEGRALQALTRYPEALEQMEAFAAKAPDDLRAKVPRLESLLTQLRARVSTLAIACNVPGARVRFRERDLASTPLPEQKLNAGPGTLEVFAEGYHPYKRELDLAGGGLSSIDVQLQSKATTGVLIVTSSVTGASLAIDDRAFGKVPMEAILPAGTHTLALDKEGYDAMRTSTVLGAGERKTVSIPLDETRPITKKWWFWTIIGVAVAGGVVTVVALTTERKPDSGSIAPGQVGGALRF